MRVDEHEGDPVCLRAAIGSGMAGALLDYNISGFQVDFVFVHYHVTLVGHDDSVIDAECLVSTVVNDSEKLTGYTFFRVIAE